MALGHLSEDIPHHGFSGFDLLLGTADSVSDLTIFQVTDDEGLKENHSHLLGQTALVDLQFGTHNDDGTTGVVNTFTQQVLTETALLTFEHIRNTLQGTVSGAGDGTTEPLGLTPDDIEGCTIGTYGLPELGTPFIQQVLLDAKPRNFADLLQISGLTHGTNVWLGNAQDLIKEGICDISRVIGTRDGIMLDMIRYGLDNAMSFKIMEAVRKGKGLTPEWEAAMREHEVPEWYITSCKKIKYLFPKAHAAAYVMSAIRLAWYKVHQPVAFYCTMFTVAPNGFDASIVRGGKNNVVAVMRDIQRRGKEASPKEQASISTLQLINEAMARGIRFLSVDLKKSHSFVFQPDNGAIRMPFSSLPGLGETAADSIIKAREEEQFFSVEDLQIRAKLSKSVIEILRVNGALDDVDETDQLTMRF